MRVETLEKYNENLFFKAFHSNPNSMAVLTFPEGICIDVNESFLRLHEYSRDEVIGQTINQLKIWGSFGKWKQLLQQLEVGGSVKNYDIDLYTKSRKKLIGLLSLERIDLNGRKCTLGCFNDLTERKKIEEEMTRLDRLNLIGEMSVNIGHEVRNPMTTVRGFLQLMGSEETSVQKKYYYEMMIEELDKANEIITEFLSLAKDKMVKLKLKSLNTLISTLYPLLSSDAVKQKKRILLSQGVIPDIPLDDKEMKQLIINLVKNGLESMRSGGTVTIGTYIQDHQVVLFVEDEGDGIRPEIFDKLGTPFVTTKDNGTGLGLAVSYSIANRHNATIDFKTGSSGTTFYLRFKLNQNQTEQ